MQSSATGADGATLNLFGADTPRFQGTARRLLIEGQRTNAIRNPRAENVTGFMPQHWPVFVAPTGLTITTTPATRNGVQGVVLAFSGTTTSAGPLFMVFETATPSANGQTWTHSFYAQVDTDSAQVTSLRIENVEETAGGGFLAGNNVEFHATRLSFARRIVTRTNTNALTERQRFSFASNSIGSGVAVAFAIFIGWPQQEQGAFASSPILPPVGTPGASTRGADLVSASLSSLGIGANGACTVLWSGVLTTTNNSQVIAHIDDGTFANRFWLEVLAGATIGVRRDLAGVNSTATPSGTFAANTPFRLGMALNGAGRAAASFNGGTVAAVTGGPTGGMATLRLGAAPSAAAVMFGETLALRVLPYTLSDTDLAAAVAALPL